MPHHVAHFYILIEREGGMWTSPGSYIYIYIYWYKNTNTDILIYTERGHA